MRNGHYYARLNFTEPGTGARETRRVRLAQAHTLPQAQAELRRLQTRRETEEPPVLRRCPKFNNYVQEYHAYYAKVTDAKRPRTVETEQVHLRAWAAHLGETRLNHITPVMLRSFFARSIKAFPCRIPAESFRFRCPARASIWALAAVVVSKSASMVSGDSCVSSIVNNPAKRATSFQP